MQAISEVKAKVTALEGSEALLEVAPTGCGRCDEPGGCGGQKLTDMLATGPKVYRVNNAIGAKVGDCVRLGIPSATLRRGATLLYVLPLLALIAGAVFGMALAGDLGAMAGGASALLAAWWLVRRHLRSGAGNLAHGPHLIISD